MSWSRFAGIHALFCIALPALALNEPRCDLTGGPLTVGPATDYVLCGDDLPDTLQITSADPDIARVIYQQPLGRCHVHDKRSGLHVVLQSGHSGETQLSFTHPATGRLICDAPLRSLPAPERAVPDWLDAMPLSGARTIDVNGIRTRYFDAGSGPPLVLVHGGQAGGANNSARKWEQNFTELSRTFRVIALDRLAQAGTDNLPAAEDYADYFMLDAQHLEAFVDALNLADVTLVGHSQGGWPVTWLALQRPDLVSCLVNVDTVMVPDDPALMGESLAFLLYVSRFVDPPDGPTIHSTRRALTLRYPSGNNITADKARRVVDQYRLPKTAEARADMARARMTPRHPAFTTLRDAAYADIRAGKLKARSLVIWGEQDPQVPLGLGRQFNQLLKQANVDTELAVIDGAGHAPFVEFPAQFNALLVRHCTGQS